MNKDNYFATEVSEDTEKSSIPKAIIAGNADFIFPSVNSVFSVAKRI